MSYEKNTWTNGDVITAARLNKMENGIANATGYDVIVCCPDNDFTNTASDYTITADYTSIVNKIVNNQSITGVAYCVYDYNNTSEDNDTMSIIPLIQVDHIEQDEVIEFVFSIVQLSGTSGMVLNGITGQKLAVQMDNENSVIYAQYWRGTKSL